MSLPLALAILAVLSLAAHRARVVDLGGVIAGCLIGLALAWTATPAPFASFLLFVFLGSVSTRLGAARKTALGVAQEKEGRRGWVHALANAGPSALVLLGFTVAGRAGGAAELAACAGLAAVLSDTAASEWGQWLGGRPRNILTGAEVPVGTDGGVTPAGLAASLGAAAIAAAAASVWLAGSVFLPILVAGFAGNLMDSVLGASIESRLGRQGGAIVNAIAAVTGIALALLLAS